MQGLYAGQAEDLQPSAFVGLRETPAKDEQADRRMHTLG